MSAHTLPELILIDDDIDVLATLQRVLKPMPVVISAFSSPLEAQKYIDKLELAPALILSDQRMPEIEGSSLLAYAHKRFPNTIKIILSSHQDFKKVSSGINNGEIDKFVCKPWSNKVLKETISEALLKFNPLNSLAPIRDKQHSIQKTNFHGMISQDARLVELFNTIKQIGKSKAPVFIHGETGTGKELVAKACHAERVNPTAPFIAVNCANFSEELIESQLFGHKKGAFTGAIADHIGLFQASGQGTLFLDEVTTLSLALQAKLLRVIQEKEFSPIGSSKSHLFEAQLITASSLSIAEAVVKGIFRDDLFYRLNVINIHLPPLRKRSQDIHILANHFLTQFCLANKKTKMHFEASALQLLEQYHWPGNVRQLENTIHSLVILNRSDIITTEMVIATLATTIEENAETSFGPRKIVPRSNNATIENITQPLWKVEKNHIEQTIERCHGNIQKAASMLEVSPSTIYRKMQQWKEVP